jgi:hypothetical protein
MLDVALGRLQEARAEAERLKALQAKALLDMKAEEARIREQNEKARALLAKYSGVLAPPAGK